MLHSSSYQKKKAKEKKKTEQTKRRLKASSGAKNKTQHCPTQAEQTKRHQVLYLKNTRE